jgi:hypothetical protein
MMFSVGKIIDLREDRDDMFLSQIALCLSDSISAPH